MSILPESITVCKNMKITQIIKEYFDPLYKQTDKTDFTVSGITVHYLKTQRPYYGDVINKDIYKRKTFEVRENDRNYKVGDYLVLQEYIHQLSGNHIPACTDIDFKLCRRVVDKNGLIGLYTGREAIFIVTYVLDNARFVMPGTVILGIREVK